MDFPKQIKQHKNESDSFAIILYKLKDLGIFRNMTQQDYGIDFELEIVENGCVCGHCVKIQVKSSENLRTDDSSHPIISGIKQSTLRYWAELSYNIPVIALCVDLKIETIYSTGALFWQSISLLNATDSSKSIKFNTFQRVEDLISEIRRIAIGYSLREALYAHKWLLRNLYDIFKMYMDSRWLDQGSQDVDLNFFRTYLEYARVILMHDICTNSMLKDVDESLLSYDYYYKKRKYEEPCNVEICCGLREIFLPVLNALESYRQRVLDTGYYWCYHDDDYLKLVLETRIPMIGTKEKLDSFNYDVFLSKQENCRFPYGLIDKIETKAKCKKGELLNYLLAKHC